MEELLILELSHMEEGRANFFYHHIKNYQDHAIVAIIHMYPMSRRTPQPEFV
jgi:hypothetical protein